MTIFYPEFLIKMCKHGPSGFLGPNIHFPAEDRA